MRENNRQTKARVCEDWRVTAVALVWRSDGNFGLASPVWRPHTLPVLLGMPAPPAYIVDGSFGAQQEGWMDRLTDNMFQLVCLETCGCPARERKTLGEKGEGNRNRIFFFFPRICRISPSLKMIGMSVRDKCVIFCGSFISRWQWHLAILMRRLII